MNTEPEIIDASPAATAPPAPGRTRRRLWLNVVLFGLTFVSAMMAQTPIIGSETSLADIARDLVREPGRLLEGLPFALTLMAILLAHEMGHYLTARRHGVDQSLPYFIPAPTIFGTFGAVIFMRSQPPNRGALLNVAVMGPFAGLAVAIPAAAWGLAHSIPVDPSSLEDGSLWFGSSLLFRALELLFSPNGGDVALHPVAFAGWVGLFVTSLNLIPAAQLDGGHVAYALWGRRQVLLSRLVVVALLVVGLAQGYERGALWLVWALLLFVIGLRHPPVRDEARPVSGRQRLVGYAALAVFVLTFMPTPVDILGGGDAPPQVDEEALPPGHPPIDAVPDDAWPSEEYHL